MGKKNKFIRVIDIHEHILPDIDDGAEDMDVSRAMLHTAYEEGITDIIVTPHYHAGSQHMRPQKVYEGIELLREYAESKDIPVNFYPGNEIMYSEEAIRDLKKRRCLTLAGSDYVLIEFYPTAAFDYLRNSLSNVQAAGYRPILAHAERYEVLVDDIEKLEFLKRLGVSIQVNAASFTKDAGRGIRKYMKQISKERLIDYIATDAHSDTHRAPKIEKALHTVIDYTDSEYAQKLIFDNALKLIINT